MRWKTKARIQNLIAGLPPTFSRVIYYRAQRHFGRLKNPDPSDKFRTAQKIWAEIHSLGIDPAGKTFFELGTGRIPNVPLALWLMGAGKIITLDSSAYLKRELLSEIIDYISANRDKVENILSPFINKERLEKITEFREKKDLTAEAILEYFDITYMGTGDAAHTKLNDGSIDFYISCTVLEHIQPDTLEEIINEANRIVNNNGLFIHRIDYSDHFSHTDKTISPINFLRYSDAEWEKYAGNRYMYMNRLRHDDFLELFNNSGQAVLVNQPTVNDYSLELLKSGALQLNEKFRARQPDRLAISSAWIITNKSRQG